VLAHKYIIKRNGDFELFQETKDTYHVIYDTSKVDSIKVPVRIFDTRYKSGGDLIFNKMHDWSQAIRMFLFFSIYSSVEWSLHVFHEIDRNKNKYVVATNQSSSSSYQSIHILEDNLKYKSTVLINDIHSHPNSKKVKVSFPSVSDHLYYEQRHNIHPNHLPNKFFIFDVNSKFLISYDKDSYQKETQSISQYLFKFMDEQIKEITGSTN